MLRSPLRAQGMSVVRLNMSHGDHKSHKAVVDLVREYNALDRGNLAIMLDTKGPEVRSGDLSEPIDMKAGGCHTLTWSPVCTGIICLAGQRQSQPSCRMLLGLSWRRVGAIPSTQRQSVPD